MSDEWPRVKAARSISDRIERLRSRLDQVPQRSEADGRMVAIVKGILDLLEDEL